MAQRSSIEWTEVTWNPVTGCTEVSQGCKNCYAKSVMKRFQPNRKFHDIQIHSDRLDAPLSWKSPKMIFVNSMSDLFHDEVNYSFIHEVITIIRKTPQHTYQILTKRPQNALEFFNALDSIPSNIWFGVSIEDQESANKRLPLLAQIEARVRWISAEPLLDYVDLSESLKNDLKYIKSGLKGCIHWVVAGGESGKKARPLHPEWVRSLRDQCSESEIPFFFKQWGEFLPFEESNQAPFWNDQLGREWDSHGLNIIDPATGDAGPGWYYDIFYGLSEFEKTGIACGFKRIGKKAAGRLLDGRVHNEFPIINR